MKILFILRLVLNVLALLFLGLYFALNNFAFAVIGYVCLAATLALAIVHIVGYVKAKNKSGVSEPV